MGNDQQESGQPAGAGSPQPPIPAVPPAAVAARADDVAEAIRKAREARGVKDSKEALIQEAIEKSETEEMRRAIGLDIPFDVKTLLTKGFVEQRGLKISDDLFIDMHTLTKAEDILAERLLEEFHGPMQLSKAYLEAKQVATLAIAITRINRDRFPVPDLDPAKRNTDDWKTDWELKRNLHKALMNMTTGDIHVLGLVYSNLEHMDILLDEGARKKSS